MPSLKATKKRQENRSGPFFSPLQKNACNPVRLMREIFSGARSAISQLRATPTGVTGTGLAFAQKEEGTFHLKPYL